MNIPLQGGFQDPARPWQSEGRKVAFEDMIRCAYSSGGTGGSRRMPKHGFDHRFHVMKLEFEQFHTEQASALLRAMGNPQRLRILLLLAEHERSVIELEALVGLSQSAVSQHLARLRHGGLVRFRRDGQMTYYALEGPEVHSILMTLHLLYGRDRNVAATPSHQHWSQANADRGD